MTLSPIELACGVVLGVDPTAPPLDDVGADVTPRRALEEVTLEALQRPPCAVSFSGGRDSSAILAIAVHVARREGLPLPLPVTLRFPACDEADERLWQEHVVGHLGLDDWTRRDLHDEIDIVGPYARRVFADHGVLWPFNAHFHLPIAEHAPGGTVLTGIGGDELLSSGRSHRLAAIRSLRARPGARDVAHLALDAAPTRVRRAVSRYRLGHRPALPWLRPSAQRALNDVRARDLADDRVAWDASVRQAWWPSRYRRIGCASVDRAIAVADATRGLHPFASAPFLAAAARAQGRAGYATRTDAMNLLVGDLLPPTILGRRSKSSFTGAFWHRYARAFAARWDGSGVDTSIVDANALREMWSQPAPDARTFLLLQAVFVGSAAELVEQS